VPSLAPNNRLQATANSVRSYLAPAICRAWAAALCSCRTAGHARYNHLCSSPAFGMGSSSEPWVSTGL